MTILSIKYSTVQYKCTILRTVMGNNNNNFQGSATSLRLSFLAAPALRLRQTLLLLSTSILSSFIIIIIIKPFFSFFDIHVHTLTIVIDYSSTPWHLKI